MSLDDLKCVATSGGCAPNEFDKAVETMGKHPLRVARYLKRHAFVPSAFEIPPGGRFPAWEAKVRRPV